MFYTLSDTIKRANFNFLCRDILRTPPLYISNSDIKIISMVSHKDLIMYLVSIKSLYHFLNQGKIVVLNDGTLTKKDKDLLNYHISPERIVDIKDIDTGRCPKGGCWERLLFVADCVKEYYAIQLDSDIVIFGDIEEVKECLSKNNSFATGTEENQVSKTIKDIADRMRLEDSRHIQVVSEKNLCKLNGYEKFKYARVGAAFAGFAKRSFTLKQIQDFSLEMGGILGKRWQEWGSEQVASNFIISNIRDAVILPYPKYASYYSGLDIDYDKSSLLHFIGTSRFRKDMYINKAKIIIDKIERIGINVSN